MGFNISELEWHNVLDKIEAIENKNKKLEALKISENLIMENIGKTIEKTCGIHDFVCCGVLEKMNLGWMELKDGTKCMPYIKGRSDENMYRVNNCPSCGKYVRDVMV